METYYLLNYVPISAEKNYGYCASEEDWMNRHEVWHFKDGNCSTRILRGLADGLNKLRKNNSVVCFIPASTWTKTVSRYGEVAQDLQNMTGIPCSYTAIKKENDCESGYLSGKKADPAEDFIFDTNFFSGKSVILIDDVVTRGRTIENTARRLLSRGAQEVVALTVAKTINPAFQNSVSARQVVSI